MEPAEAGRCTNMSERPQDSISIIDKSLHNDVIPWIQVAKPGTPAPDEPNARQEIYGL